MTEDQRSLVERFGTMTGDDGDKFECLTTEVGMRQVPLLVVAPNRLVVRRVALVDEGGDHVCVTTELVAAESSGPFRPLRLSAVADLVPGHDNEEPNHPPADPASG